MSIKTLIKIATDEIGYLEKASEKDLNSKTGNAGRGNFTKYWRDLRPGYQGEPWCNAFVNWCFWKAYGLTNAKRLLCCSSFDYYTPTTAEYFQDAGQWSQEPRVGDVVYFRNSSRIHHVGLVVSVTGDTFTTVEGNTSKPAGKTDEAVVENGGGVWSKTYSRGNRSIAGYGHPNYKGMCQVFVQRLYKEILGREGESAGVEYWTNGLAKGLETGVSAARGFLLGAEYASKNKSDRAFLTDCYRGLLGRKPDESGYNFWLGRMANGRLSREDVCHGFAVSAEYINECYRVGIDRGKW